MGSAEDPLRPWTARSRRRCRRKSFGPELRIQFRGRGGGGAMDATVDDLSAAYEEFMAAAAAVIEARAQAGGGVKTPATDAALENFKQRWELFRVACDHAEELVESLRQRIGSECLVDEATGSSSSAPAALGIKPISAVRLEQMSKAVRWLVIELQQGAGGGSAPPAGAGGAATPTAGASAGGQQGQSGVDARFSEDGAQ